MNQDAIHELIAKRWSPRSFDPRPVPAGDLAAIFEAARWAPSAFNEQPWRFLVATQDQPEEFARILSVLVTPNQAWAQNAPVLALGIAKRTYTRNGRENTAALHDLGQAVATLTFEATSRGLAVHQMAGILPEHARALYGIPEEYEILTAIAIGYQSPTAQSGPRSRKPLSEIVFSGAWEKPAPLSAPAPEFLAAKV